MDLCSPLSTGEVKLEMNRSAPSGLLEFQVPRPLECLILGVWHIPSLWVLHAAKMGGGVNTHIMHLATYYHSALNSRVENNKKGPNTESYSADGGVFLSGGMKKSFKKNENLQT